MTILEAAIVRRKLRRIRQNLATLAGITAQMSLAMYTTDEVRRRAVERLLQETIDTAVDINNHLLRAAGLPPSEDLFGSFVDVGRAGILEVELGLSLAPAAGLRNRIVHEYDELDDAQILRAAEEAPERFGSFLIAIEAYLTSRGL